MSGDESSRCPVCKPELIPHWQNSTQTNLFPEITPKSAGHAAYCRCARCQDIQT